MAELTEKLDGSGAVKATMLQAHLEWAEEQAPGAVDRVRGEADEECRRLLSARLLATQWIPFRCLVRIDRALAGAVGGPLPEILRQMGRHSAAINLGGVYRVFVKDQPHQFFTQMTLLHSRFQSFGQPVYERTGERSGRLRIEGCEEYSPVYCASALGYYEGALEMMSVEGPVGARETTCQCAGDAVCRYELSW